MMMKRITRTVALAAAVAAGSWLAAAPGALAADGEGARRVLVLGRTWIVTPQGDAQGHYSAERLNAELIPFRPPAMIGARQAARAYQAATGCSPNYGTMYKTITGVYHARLICGR